MAGDGFPLARARIFMIADRVSAALDRRGVHYAWVIALVTFLAMLTTAAALGLPR